MASHVVISDSDSSDSSDDWYFDEEDRPRSKTRMLFDDEAELGELKASVMKRTPPTDAWRNADHKINGRKKRAYVNKYIYEEKKMLKAGLINERERFVKKKKKKKKKRGTNDYRSFGAAELDEIRQFDKAKVTKYYGFTNAKHKARGRPRPSWYAKWGELKAKRKAEEALAKEMGEGVAATTDDDRAMVEEEGDPDPLWFSEMGEEPMPMLMEADEYRPIDVIATSVAAKLKDSFPVDDIGDAVAKKVTFPSVDEFAAKLKDSFPIDELGDAVAKKVALHIDNAFPVAEIGSVVATKILETAKMGFSTLTIHRGAALSGKVTCCDRELMVMISPPKTMQNVRAQCPKCKSFYLIDANIRFTRID